MSTSQKLGAAVALVVGFLLFVLPTVLSSFLPARIPTRVVEVICGCVVLVVGGCLLPTRVNAFNHRVLIRSYLTDESMLSHGSFWLHAPYYVVDDSSQYGPWSKWDDLPLPGELIDVDLPPSVVSVDHGTYSLSVNTKVQGRVRTYTLQDLQTNRTPTETCLHDSITEALRKAVHAKPLEEAIAEIQRLFAHQHAELSDIVLVGAPPFEPTRLMLDADKQIEPASPATKEAMQLVVARKQQAAQRAVQEERHVSAMREQAMHVELELERQRQEELARRALQLEQHATAMEAVEHELAQKSAQQQVHELEMKRHAEELRLAKEAYGAEGAAQVEASKHARASYVLIGGAPSAMRTNLQLPPLAA